MNPKGHEVSSARGRFANRDRCVEGPDIFNNVVARHHENQRIISMKIARDGRRHNDRWGRVARTWFEDQSSRIFVSGERTFAQFRMALTAHDYWSGEPETVANAMKRFLEERAVAKQGKKLFGAGLCGKWPQTTATPSAEYDRND
jgi:hypothetical protein